MWGSVTSSQNVGANVNVFGWTFASEKGAYSSVATSTKGDGTLVKTTGDESWSGTITMHGKYVVEDGHTITIAPGTVIKAKNGSGGPENAAAFVVAKGGKVMAEGTADDPIIFTADADPLDGTNLQTKGLWGGVVILGKAKAGTKGTGADIGTASIEGIPATEGLIYGGTDDADNSGVLKYVSIRYGGTALATDEEINGLTLGGVGSGTVLDNIEVIYNDDDGIEFFGGTVDASNLVVWAQKDDAIDVDQAYSGTITNALVIMDTGSDNVFEIDGSEGNDATGTDLQRAHTVTNVTAIGPGNNTKIDQYGHWKSNAKGTYSNIYYTNFKDGTVFEGFTNTNATNTGELSFANVEINTTQAAAAAFKVGVYDSNDSYTGSAAIEGYNLWGSVVSTQTTTVGSDNSGFGWTFYASLNTLPTSATLSIEDIVSDNTTNFSVFVYPNPASNIVNVSTNANVNNIDIYNVTGKKVKSSSEDSIDVSDLLNGIYIITINTDKGLETKRLIKN